MIFGLRALLVAAFFVLASNVLQNIYIPTLAVSKGIPAFQVGMMGSFYFVGFVIGCLVLPRLLYAVGHIRMFCSFAAISAISTLTISMTNSYEVWFLCRLVTGVCLSALYFSIESWISGFSTKANRGRIISIYRIIDIAGCLFGQMILFTMADFDNLLNFTAIGFLLSMLPLSLTQVQTPVLVEASSEKLLNIFKTVAKATPLSLYGAFLSGFSSGIFWSLIPMFTKSNDISSNFIPLIVCLYLIGGAILQWPLGMISDKLDRRKIIFCSSLLGLSATWGINYLVHTGLDNMTLLYILIAIMGGGSIPIYSLSMAHANDLINKNSVVGLSVLMLVLSSVGSVIGPFSFGLASEFISAKYLFVFSASAMSLLFITSIYYILTKEKIQQANKKMFLFLTRNSSIVVANTPNSPKQ